LLSQNIDNLSQKSFSERWILDLPVVPDFLVFLAQKKNVAFSIKANGIQEYSREIIAI
jgi:hypothetical protein